MERRTARGQNLPLEEVEHLRSLRGFNLFARSYQLFEAGWPLRAIGEAFEPPKSRSTVKNWVERGENTAPRPPYTPVPTPTLATPPEYVPVKAPSPGISASDKAEIARLAPSARRFRAKVSKNHPSRAANTELTALCTRLYTENVPISELAAAAGVTYRAMAKRLGKA